MRTLTHLALLALLSGISSVPAAASSFSGSTISWRYYARGGVYTGRDSSCTFVDSGGVGGTFIKAIGLKYLTSSQAPTTSGSITQRLHRVPGLMGKQHRSKPPRLYNGVDALFCDGAGIDLAQTDPATNRAGLDRCRAYFTGNEIEVGRYQLAYDKSTIVKLDLNRAAPTPETGTLTMLGDECLDRRLLPGGGISLKLDWKPARGKL